MSVSMTRQPLARNAERPIKMSAMNPTMAIKIPSQQSSMSSCIAPLRRKQRGATMIELLVSFLIFSLGMLGVAGLQTKTVAFSQASLTRSQASALADDIIDRMRADRVNAIAGKWNTDADKSAAEVVTTGTGIYSTDLKDWKSQVEDLLPEGKAKIFVQTGTVTIDIWWNDSRGAEDDYHFHTVTKL